MSSPLRFFSYRHYDDDADDSNEDKETGGCWNKV
jgi:hypothetical protein